jgi:hypothetical protein
MKTILVIVSMIISGTVLSATIDPRISGENFNKNSQETDGVVIVSEDPKEMSTSDKLDRLDSKLDRMLSLGEENLTVTKSVVKSLGGLEKSNKENALLIVAAIKASPPEEKTVTKSPVDNPTQKVTRYKTETQTVMQKVCYGDYCRMEPVTKTVKVPYTVEVPAKDVIPVDPYTGPEMPGEVYCDGDCSPNTLFNRNGIRSRFQSIRNRWINFFANLRIRSLNRRSSRASSWVR